MRPPALVAEPGACANCAAPLAGPYCHACGQSAADHLGSLRGLAAHVAETALQYDARVPRSARALLTRPGTLTTEYLAGRRARFVGPMQLYAAAAALLFLAGTVRPLVTFDPRTRWFRSGLGGMIGYANRLTDPEVARLAARGISLELFGERFVTAATGQLSTFLLASVPLFALVVAVVHWRARRPLPHHVVFAQHWSAFFLLVMAVGQLLPTRYPRPVAVLLGVVFVGGTTAYLAVALRRTYGGRWPAVALRAVLLMVAYQAILFVWLESVVGMARRGI
jgi:hypothetical protein